MTQKKSYNRYFIILQEDEKGYSQASDKMSSGYAKIEIKNDKCKISYYVQNLKKDSSPYYMILICAKKGEKKLINMGELNMDSSGRTEISFEYLSDNIAQTGISIDKVSGAAIVKFVQKNLISIMSGHLSTEVLEWKAYEIVRKDIKEEQLDFKEVSQNRSDDKNVFDEYEESIEKGKETQIKNNIDIKADNEDVKKEDNLAQRVSEDHSGKHEDYAKDEKSKEKDDTDKINEVKTDDGEADVKTLGVQDMRSKEAKSKHKTSDEEKIEKMIKGCEYNKDNIGNIEDMPKGAVGEFFKAIVKGYEEVFDVCGEIKRCRWFKIPVKYPMDMADTSNYNKYTVIYYPMINYFPYIKKYGHFMLGYKCDSDGNMKYLVYAIPGTKSKYEQPFEGKSGFVTWQALKNGESKEDNFGYWIMFYDFRTSTIVIPIR